MLTQRRQRQLDGHGPEKCIKKEDHHEAGEGLSLHERNVVQLGPYPYYLVDEMKDSPLKESLSTFIDRYIVAFEKF